MASPNKAELLKLSGISTWQGLVTTLSSGEQTYMAAERNGALRPPGTLPDPETSQAVAPPTAFYSRTGGASGRGGSNNNRKYLPNTVSVTPWASNAIERKEGR